MTATGPANGRWVDGRSSHPLYGRYLQMISRCTNPGDHQWPNYGGRGIKVCARWLADFANYAADVGECPSGMTLDRIDNDGDYEPDNVRWATKTEQNRNRRKYRRVLTCRKGHPFDERNTYVAKSGKRQCRACGADRKRRFRLRT